MKHNVFLKMMNIRKNPKNHLLTKQKNNFKSIFSARISNLYFNLEISVFSPNMGKYGPEKNSEFGLIGTGQIKPRIFEYFPDYFPYLFYDHSNLFHTACLYLL